MSEDNIAAVILAAGASSRMSGVKKEFARLKRRTEISGGDTVLESCVRTFSALTENIIIVIPEGCEEEARSALPKEFFNNKSFKINFVTGGSTRRASVFNALSFLASFNPDYVLIHDGARPWVSSSLVKNSIAAVKKYNAVVPVLQLTETPKEVGSEQCEVGFIKRHLKRVNVGLAQTPQTFKFSGIFDAHQKAAQVIGEEFTDDAEIWDRFCGKVAVIPGELENKKITFLQDLD